MTYKFPMAVLIAAFAAPAAAQTYACEPWSAPGYEEAGPFTFTVSEASAMWSNGAKAVTSDLIFEGVGAMVFTDGRDLIVTSNARGAESRITLRRILIDAPVPENIARCNPA